MKLPSVTYDLTKESFRSSERNGDNMMTVLNIIKDENKGLVKKILSCIKPYKIDTEMKQYGDFSIYTIHYYQRKGKIRTDKIYDVMRGKNKVILCDKNINLFNTPFRRFTSNALKRKLMQNYLFDVLKKANIDPSVLRISYYDPDAEFPSLARALLDYTSNLTVVTDMPKFYENEAERIFASCGASVTVSNHIDHLYPCDILISPAVIRKPISAAASTLIFTVQRPTVTVTGNVICDYKINLSNEYQSIIPDYIDEDYFLSGLYVICKQNNLGKYIPYACGNQFELYSPEIIIRQIRAKCMISVV